MQINSSNPHTIVSFLKLAGTLKDFIKAKNYQSAYRVKDAMVDMNCQEISYEFIQELFQLLPPRQQTINN
jgi:hypothetical protein